MQAQLKPITLANQAHARVGFSASAHAHAQAQALEGGISGKTQAFCSCNESVARGILPAAQAYPKPPNGFAKYIGRSSLLQALFPSLAHSLPDGVP